MPFPAVRETPDLRVRALGTTKSSNVIKSTEVQLFL